MNRSRWTRRESRVRRWLPDALMVVCATYCAGVAAYGVMTTVRANTLYGWNIIALGPPVALAAGLACALLLPRSARKRLALAVGSFFAAIFAAELYLTDTGEWTPPEMPLDMPMRRAASEAGRPLDMRTKRQVVRDLRSRGVDAVPTVPSNFGVTIAGPDGRALPILGGVSLATSVYCNESGQHVIYTADEHGFNNPRGMHGRAPLQLAVLGDSFTHGACVPPEASLAGLARKVFPDTLNLGIGGAGPLSTLARFVEYAAPLRPRFIVWNWFERNDLADLSREIVSAPLRRYLTTEASFGLRTRQAEIDRALRDAIDARMMERRQRTIPEQVEDVLLLRSLRTRLRLVTTLLTLRPWAPNRKELAGQEGLGIVEDILTTAQDVAQGWDGELLVVYLPDASRYCDVAPGRSWRRYCATDFAQDAIENQITYRDEMLAMLARLGITVVDGHSAFVDSGRPTDMFYYPESHYSPAGYRVIADALLRELTARLGTAEAVSFAP